MPAITEERNLKHETAKYAYECIEDVVTSDTKEDKYRSEVMQTGFRLYGAGLMQTLAFYCSKMKKDKHFRKLSLHLLKWTLRDEVINKGMINCSQWNENEAQTMGLFSVLLDKSDDEMRFYAQRAMDVTEWLKRFAEAKLKK